MTHFKPDEFTCRCGRPECDAPKAISPALAEKLDALREAVGRPLVVNSGIRCPYWNEKQGGVRGSEHETGEGADIACRDDALRYRLIKYGVLIFPRMGIGRTFVHFGVSLKHTTAVCWTYYPGEKQ